MLAGDVNFGTFFLPRMNGMNTDDCHRDTEHTEIGFIYTDNISVLQSLKTKFYQQTFLVNALQ